MTTGAYRRRDGSRRGVILILVLGVLGLMAVIGVTFATFTGQSRIATRSFAQSKIQPQGEELMDFALAQLITDTNDVRSAIRGHSLARDMYGNDAAHNGFVEYRSDGAQMPPNADPFFYITDAAAVGTGPLYDLETNIPAGDPLFYGFDFTRWTIKVAYVGPQIGPAIRVINQSLEVVADSGFIPGATGSRILRVVIKPEDVNAEIVNPNYRDTPNSTPYTLGTITPAKQMLYLLGQNAALGTSFRFTLDGRWLHAFNGPGKTTDAKYGNFRYNLDSPAAAGMDEDYDAVDLENWFLAMQSADGQLVIPSFHRPAIVRYDQGGTGDVDNKNDWTNEVDASKPPADQAIALRKKISRIFRPRQADGHDPQAFPDLTPGPDGKINYDVDNDGDGIGDSVWVDLGYPARRNAQGNLFKPMFAFMVIGLNGRMPLNTVGNMAARGGVSGDEPQSAHAAHLGTSVSEIDPTYGLQNGVSAAGPYDQVDDAGVDVRLTQLRNLLAGTRPQPDPASFDATGLVNGDANRVRMGGSAYYLPNGQVDNSDVDEGGVRPPTGNVRRRTEAVPGRWGEPDSVPGGDYNYLTTAYANEVRPGYSLSFKDYATSSRPLDSADDDYNSFDIYPPPYSVTGNRFGEVRDRDFYDASGSIVFPIERIRRFVTPMDINGSGRVVRFNARGPNSNAGGDAWGRVEYRGFYRPPGLPGQVDPTSGAIAFWNPSGAAGYPNLNVIQANVAAGTSHNNNMLHGFESHLVPNTRGTPQRSGGILAYVSTTNLTPGTPTQIPTYDENINTGKNYTYTGANESDGSNVAVTISSRSDGLNEADEMNVYNPNTTLDAPYGLADLEWLYRSHDVDGQALSSRLSQLAPISFTNDQDGLRRRRLYSIDTWESNTFAWANDNPLNLFPNNSRFVALGNANAADANTTYLPVTQNALPYTPSLAQRGRKINLNMPLPVSNNPTESIRRKWISDAYQLLKISLPPRAVDTPEELAQLGQYLVNLIDFRDPDCTMTIWDNPDVYFVPVGRNGQPVVNTQPQLTFHPPTGVAGITNLRHFGMEYNPVAINEVLAYSYGRRDGNVGNGTPTGRFFIELANTLSRPAGAATDDANGSVINLSGYDPSVAANKPYDGACWDLVFSKDSIDSRPDPFTGQIQQGATLYGVTPLGVGALASKVGAGIGEGIAKGALLRALPQAPAGSPPLGVFGFVHPDSTNEAKHEHSVGAAGTTWEASTAFSGTPTGTLYLMNTAYDPFNGVAKPALTLNGGGGGGVLPKALDGTAMSWTTFAPAQIPRAAGSGAYYWVHLRRPANPMAPVSDDNPMVVVDSMRFPYVDVAVAAETTNSPMPTNDPTKVDKVPADLPATHLYSYQRFQPYRGGQAVPWDPAAAGAIDPRYGYTEQVAAPTSQTGTMAVYFGSSATLRVETGNSTTGQVSQQIYNTLGLSNDGTTTEFWDWFPFHDRDFASPYELTLVPGCGPGLFTKQFAEFAPSALNEPGFKAAAAGALVTNYGGITTKPTAPTGSDPANALAAMPFLFRGNASPVEPHTFPYLIDKFFYTGANPIAAADAPYNYNTMTRAETGTVGGYASDGWFKMFEFFEVPGQSTGSIGPVEEGTNFDWARQDARPGLLNLNLIIDEEVFFGLLGLQDMTGGSAFAQKLLNATQIGQTYLTGGVWTDPTSMSYPKSTPLNLPAATYAKSPMVVTASMANGAPAYAFPMPNVGYVDVATGSNQMKAAFAQFLWMRHGGSGFVFGFGEGETGQNTVFQPATAFTPPTPYDATQYTGIPAERPFRSPSFPDVQFTSLRPAAMAPSHYTDPMIGATNVDDPGVRNQVLFHGYERSSWAGSTNAAPVYPPPIPARRFFQQADAYATGGGSNAGLDGDPYVNVIKSTNNPVTGTLPGGIAGIGDAPNLFPGTLGAAGVTNMTQHPYFRGEQMQRILNLTTVRTHQFAVWITIGFFEVKREGDIAMIGDPTYPTAAFDLLGPEIGAATGQNTRYRSFFVVDRLKLTGFDPDSVGAYRPAVVYRRTIQ